VRVLIGCEYSGVVRRAFRSLGHEAFSCDLLPAEDNDPHHLQTSVLDVLDLGWDLAIFHPPCTYLCNSGVRWLYTQPGRRAKMAEARGLFMALLGCSIPRIAVENPIPHKHAMLPPYTQTIQPWQFGHGETKRTCLWLRGLPMLRPTTIVSGREARIHKMSPGPNRGHERSRTYDGIAVAMAAQWGRLDVHGACEQLELTYSSERL
jgi:hypothetical protein